MPDVIIAGPEGRIEGKYKHNPDDTSPIALIMHPHPQHGGTMNNKVCYTMYHAFADRGFSVLRFNFRGVGRSQGVYDRGEGELADAASALDWLQTHNPAARECWIGGYSFGAWIGMQLLMRRPEIASFISIAPPANLYDFTFLAPCPASGLVLQGNRDTLVPSDSVRKLTEKLSDQKGINVEFKDVLNADHYFGPHLEELRTETLAYLDANMGQNTDGPKSSPSHPLSDSGF